MEKKDRRPVMQFGVEIETATTVQCNDIGDEIDLPDGWDFHEDSSISPAIGYGTEFVSPPYAAKDLGKMEADIEKIWKDAVQPAGINSTMGTHIHISFKNPAHYYAVFNYAFAKKFEADYREFFKDDERALRRLENHFCEYYRGVDAFRQHTAQQVATTEKSQYRYHIINFNAYRRYKTIEFRIFPRLTNPKDLRKWVLFVKKSVTEYLATQRERKIVAESPFEGTGEPVEIVAESKVFV